MKELAENQAREWAEWEYWEKDKQNVEFWVKRVEEECQTHKVAAWKVAKAKLLQHQV